MEWSLLAPLDTAGRQRVLSSARRRSFVKGEVICHAGDPADSLHLVESGRLAVRLSTRGGDTATLTILSPGDFFGELALLRPPDERRRTASVTCLEPTQTLSLTAKEFHLLCHEHPAVNQLLMVALATRVEELSERLLEVRYLGLDRRVIRTLLKLSTVYADESPETMIPLTQDQLADLVGGTRPTVNQILTRLADQHLIQVNRGRLTVLDPVTLRRKAGFETS